MVFAHQLVPPVSDPPGELQDFLFLIVSFGVNRGTEKTKAVDAGHVDGTGEGRAESGPVLVPLGRLLFTVRNCVDPGLDCKDGIVGRTSLSSCPKILTVAFGGNTNPIDYTFETILDEM